MFLLLLLLFMHFLNFITKISRKLKYTLKNFEFCILTLIQFGSKIQLRFIFLPFFADPQTYLTQNFPPRIKNAV